MKVPRDLNEIFERVSDGSMTSEKGLTLIMEDMIAFPARYGLAKYSDEFRSEIILHIFEKHRDIFSRFEKRNCQFRTYFYSLVHYSIKTHVTKLSQKKLQEAGSLIFSRLNYESTIDKYNRNEYSFHLSDITPYALQKTDRPPYRDTKTLASALRNSEHKPDEYEPEQKKEGIEEPIKAWFKKYKPSERLRKTALILALKSSSFLTDDMLASISEFCRIPQNELEKTVAALNKTLEEQSDKHDREISKLDRDFYLARSTEVQICNTNDSAKKAELKKLYAIHRRSWLLKAQDLRRPRLTICPSNKSLAKVLGICERQVGYYLQNAEEVVDEFLSKKP